MSMLAWTFARLTWNVSGLRFLPWSTCACCSRNATCWMRKSALNAYLASLAVSLTNLPVASRVNAWEFWITLRRLLAWMSVSGCASQSLDAGGSPMWAHRLVVSSTRLAQNWMSLAVIVSLQREGAWMRNHHQQQSVQQHQLMLPQLLHQEVRNYIITSTLKMFLKNLIQFIVKA